jgi:hypothetical protein
MGHHGQSGLPMWPQYSLVFQRSTYDMQTLGEVGDFGDYSETTETIRRGGVRYRRQTALIRTLHTFAMLIFVISVTLG